MKVKLLRAARIRHEAGEIVEVSPAEAGFLVSTMSAVRIAEAPAVPETPEGKTEPEAPAGRETPEEKTEPKTTRAKKPAAKK